MIDAAEMSRKLSRYRHEVLLLGEVDTHLEQYITGDDIETLLAELLMLRAYEAQSDHLAETLFESEPE